MSSWDVRNVVFSKPRFGTRGYDQEEVDAFLDIIALAFDGTGKANPASMVHNVAFKKPQIGKRGYNKKEVDEFLHRIEEECARRWPGATW
jgi:DivIVA domain-containing protein